MYLSGDHVRIMGLTSDNGLRLNGQPGIVMSELSSQKGRQQVFVVGQNLMVKPTNLRKILPRPLKMESSTR